MPQGNNQLLYTRYLLHFDSSIFLHERYMFSGYLNNEVLLEGTPYLSRTEGIRNSVAYVYFEKKILSI